MNVILLAAPTLHAGAMGNLHLRVQWANFEFLDFERLHFKSCATSFWLPLLKMALPKLNHLTLDGILSCLVHRAIANMEDFGCAKGGHVIGGNDSRVNHVNDHLGNDHVKLFDAVEFACGVGNLTRALINEGFVCCALDLIHSWPSLVDSISQQLRPESLALQHQAQLICEHLCFGVQKVTGEIVLW